MDEHKKRFERLSRGGLMSYSKYKPAFDRDGFVVVRQFLDDDDFRELNVQLDRYIREVVPTRGCPSNS